MVIEKEIGELLRSRHLTMGTAESCTGGYIAHLITRVAGSSDYFCGGVVSYSNEVKHHVLGVSEDSLAQYGAVSRPVVEQMALGAIRVLGCDCAVATSGIAGPGGGTPEKPVGTVWIAAALKDMVVSECCHFGTEREDNIRLAANTALRMLQQLLIKYVSHYLLAFRCETSCIKHPVVSRAVWLDTLNCGKACSSLSTNVSPKDVYKLSAVEL